jgi:hypothetical protein
MTVDVLTWWTLEGPTHWVRATRVMLRARCGCTADWHDMGESMTWRCRRHRMEPPLIPPPEQGPC